MKFEEENGKKIEGQENKEVPVVQESSEALQQKMTEQSQEEVTDFQAEGKNELENIEESATKDSLVIDESDKSELKGLDQEANGAKEELAVEISTKETLAADVEQKTDPKAVLRKGMEMVHNLYNKGETQSEQYKTLSEVLIADGKWKSVDQIDITKLQEIMKDKEKNSDDEKLSSEIKEKVVLENKSAMKERVIENPELLDKKEVSKKFLAEERAKLAQEIWAKRNAQRERLSKLKNIIDVAQEKIEGENGDKQYGKIAELQSHEANLSAERISSENLSEQDANEEKENMAQLISNSEGLKSIKTKLQEHYAKADEIAQKKFESIRKTVEQTMLRNKAFIVHTFLLDERLRHNANSNISKRATLEDDMDILLSLEPSISTSSVMPGSRHGLWNEGMGVIIGGGEIRGGAQTDNQTQTGGIKERNGTISTSEEIDEMVSDKDARGYNELVVNNPKVFGFFQNVIIDDNGKMSGFNPRYSNKENFMQHMNLAKEKGMPLMVMTPDRKLFEFVDIGDNGIVSIGSEITPEQIATGKAGLPEEKRRELGENVISKNLFKKIGDQKEAKGIIAELSGQENGEIELSNEEYLAYAKDNEGGFHNFPEKLRDDKEFMMEAAKYNPVDAYNYVSENLKRDIDFIKHVYSLEKKGITSSIYSLIPKDLQKNELVAELAIDNNDFDNLDVACIDSENVWNRLVEKLVNNASPDKYFENGIGNVRVKNSDLFVHDGTKSINIKQKLLSDQNYIKKLNDIYSNYKFEVDEYGELIIRKLI